MRSVHPGRAAGLVGQVAVLAALAGTVGLGTSGWVVGVAVGMVTTVLLDRSLAWGGASRLGPANQVTLARATLVGGVAALTADSLSRPTPVPALVALSAVALVLDAVDGRVARRTRTESAIGARFDMEVDAFLILVLSVYVSGSVGAWVLAIGGARYALMAAEQVFPWLRRPVPPRYWRKVVAAVQGITLTVVASEVLPPSAAVVTLVVALALLVESFGRDVRWLWRQRTLDPVPATPPTARPAHQHDRAASPVRAAVVSVLALVLLWSALVAPDQIGGLTPRAFLRIPVEGLVAVAVALALPRRGRGWFAGVTGAVFALVAILKILDMGFFAALGRPFNPVIDGGYVGSGVGLLIAAVGRRDAVVALVAAATVGIALAVLLPLALLRLTKLADRHRTTSVRTLSGLGVAWVVCAALGLQVLPGVPVASSSATDLASAQVTQIRAAMTDQKTFAEAASLDPFRSTPGEALLTGLRGKDVLVVFVESYGRVAVQGSDVAPTITPVLDAGTDRLRASGFGARSAFLSSPTYGGISWLAHSTFQSGLQIDNQRRYDDLVAGERLTLSDAFNRAGWRTVADVPANHEGWPEGRSFYHYDTVYDARDVGYAGPAFGYASMPDQYTLAAFRRLELADPDHPPVMAEIDLVSSHTPWAPLPDLVAWDDIGDGSVYKDMAAHGQSAEAVWRDPSAVRAAYAQSIAYSLEAVISFVLTSHDDDLVLVILGDHQPSTIVSGPEAGHDVPVTVLAYDPAVLDRIDAWGWDDGLRPDPDAPVWPMADFRDRFLVAYGPQGAP